MSFNIQDIFETFEYNKDSIKNNAELTNDYVVDEIMNNLGYNKKRDRHIKLSFNDALMWRIKKDEDNILAVSVIGYGNDITEQCIEDAMNKAVEENFKALIISNGSNTVLYNISNGVNKNAVTLVELADTLENSHYDENISAISKELFDLSKFGETKNIITLTDDEIKEVIKTNENEISEFICTIIEDNEYSNKNNIIHVVDTLVNSENKVSESVDTASAVGLSSEKEKQFRDKINELSCQLADAEESVRQASAEVAKYKEMIDEYEKQSMKKTDTLLGIIEDNPDFPRSYVAVVDTEIMQYDELSTFIGRVLQKLFDIKHYEASQKIFSESSIKLTQPAVRNDLFMNGKTYDIDVRGMHEDDALNKLRILFSNFDDIPFRCKKIGNLNISIIKPKFAGSENLEETLEEEKVPSYDEINTEENTTETVTNEEETVKKEEDIPSDTNDRLQRIVAEVVNETLVKTPDSVENIENSDIETAVENAETTSESNETTVESNEPEVQLNEAPVENTETLEIKEDDTVDDVNANTVLLVSQIAQLNQLIWNNESTKFTNIKYIGSSDITLDINSKELEVTNAQLLAKCINAVLALAESIQDKSVISRLRTAELSAVNSYIKFYTTEYKDCVKINNTRYVITDIPDINQVASILSDICYKLNIDVSDMFIYMSAITDNEEIINDWGYEEEAVQLRDYVDVPENTNHNIAVIDGKIFNNIIITKNSLLAHKNVIEKALVFKTEYAMYDFSKAPNKIANMNDYVIEAFKSIVDNATKINSNVPVENIGNVLGESYKVISTNEANVSSNHVVMIVNNINYYISVLEDWQVPLALIKAHTTLMNDIRVMIKISIKSDVLNFYMNNFETSEPSYELGVKSFANYISGSIKQ